MALAVLAAGCGSSSTGGPVTAAKLTKAIDLTRQIRSAHIVQSFTVSSPEGGEQGNVSGDVDFGSNNGSGALSLGTVQEHTVFKGSTVWLSMNAPQFTHDLPSGKSWVQSTSSVLESYGAFHPLIDSLALLDGLRGVQKITSSGHDDATFRFSLSQAIARTPSSRRAALENAIHATGNGMKETGSVTLTPSGLVHSETLRIDGTGQQAGLHLFETLVVSNIGETVNPSAPSSSQVVPLSALPALQSQLRASASSG